MILFITLLLWFGYWSAESGGSLPWSKSWQDKISFGSEIPEVIVAISIGVAAVLGWDKVLDLHWGHKTAVLVLSALVAYAAKQSATFALLHWTTRVAPKDHQDRRSTLRGLNDFIAKIFGYKMGQEGYSWVWAATKGFLMTLPIGGAGIIFHPLGHEIGSHAKGRLPGDPNMWKELVGGGLCYAGACTVFYLFI